MCELLFFFLSLLSTDSMAKSLVHTRDTVILVAIRSIVVIKAHSIHKCLGGAVQLTSELQGHFKS